MSYKVYKTSFTEYFLDTQNPVKFTLYGFSFIIGVSIIMFLITKYLP